MSAPITGAEINRRSFLSRALIASATPFVAPGSAMARNLLYPTPPLKIDIRPTQLDIGGGIVIPTTSYDGQVPDPLLRMREGEEVRVHVTNHTASDELVHWHGLHVSSPMDGAEEEGSPLLHAGKTAEYRFVPKPRGSRWVHSHMMAHKDLSKGGYSGQFGFLYIDPMNEPGRYDREEFLAIHHWDGAFHPMGRPIGDLMVAYAHATFNDRLYKAAAPIRVRQGQRIMFRFLNASATQNSSIALAGHRFTVVALDGNPVPRPTSVKTLHLGVAERVDAIVEMNNPGRWLLGATDPVERAAGLARLIEYEGFGGDPVWQEPGASDWSYRLFADPVARPAQPVAEIFPMVFSKQFTPVNGMDLWQINQASYPDTRPIRVRRGERYRFRLMNASREPHPVHFHRHDFEITSISGAPMSGLVKDTVVLPLYGSVEIDWVANNPGLSLFHCHQQVHMDAGFMQMVEHCD